MGRTHFWHLAVVVGLLSSAEAARAQVHYSQARHEAQATANALLMSGQDFTFSARGTEDGHPWSVFASRISNRSGGGGFALPYYFVPFYVAPTPYAPQAPPGDSPGSRPAWLDREELRKRPPLVLRPRRDVKPEAQDKSEKLLAEGDASFAQQKYTAAVQHYRNAAKQSPDWADPQFRIGFALVASGDYARAVTAFRAGLKLRADWSDSPFRLDTLYAAGALDKANQKLAQRLARTPLEPDLLFARGMQLFFAGQHQQSTMYLSQAASMQAIEPGLLDAFLKPADAEAK